MLAKLTCQSDNNFREQPIPNSGPMISVSSNCFLGPNMSAMPENRELVAAMARLDALTDCERRPLRGMRVGLGPMQDLTALLGKPQKALRAVQSQPGSRARTASTTRPLTRLSPPAASIAPKEQVRSIPGRIASEFAIAYVEPASAFRPHTRGKTSNANPAAVASAIVP